MTFSIKRHYFFAKNRTNEKKNRPMFFIYECYESIWLCNHSARDVQHVRSKLLNMECGMLWLLYVFFSSPPSLSLPFLRFFFFSCHKQIHVKLHVIDTLFLNNNFTFKVKLPCRSKWINCFFVPSSFFPSWLPWSVQVGSQLEGKDEKIRRNPLSATLSFDLQLWKKKIDCSWHPFAKT